MASLLLLSVVGLGEAKVIQISGRFLAKQFVVAYAKDTVAAMTDKITWYTLLGSIGCGPGVLEAGIEPFLKRDEQGDQAQIAFNDPKQNPWYWWAGGIYSNPVTALHEGMSAGMKTADFMASLHDKGITCKPLVNLGADYKSKDNTQRQQARMLFSQMATDLLKDYVKGFTSGSGTRERSEQVYCSVLDDEQTGGRGS